jgi:hypothetical protein
MHRLVEGAWLIWRYSSRALDDSTPKLIGMSMAPRKPSPPDSEVNLSAP